MSSFEDRLPPDLRDVAERVHVSRAEATPLELDELKRSARAKAARRGRSYAPTRRSRVLTLAITALLIGGTTAGGIATGGGSSNQSSSCAQYKPGNGFGDKNHNHTGPPGQTGTNPCGNGNGNGNNGKGNNGNGNNGKGNNGNGSPGNSGNAPGHNK